MRPDSEVASGQELPRTALRARLMPRSVNGAIYLGEPPDREANREERGIARNVDFTGGAGYEVSTSSS